MLKWQLEGKIEKLKEQRDIATILAICLFLALIGIIALFNNVDYDCIQWGEITEENYLHYCPEDVCEPLLNEDGELELHYKDGTTITQTCTVEKNIRTREGKTTLNQPPKYIN